MFQPLSLLPLRDDLTQGFLQMFQIGLIPLAFPWKGSSLQVEILFIYLSVITFYSFPYSDSKLTQPPPDNLSHATSPTVSNVPIYVSHARQSTGPPSQSTGPSMNISIWG